MPPTICRRSAIFARIAPSSVAGILVCTISTAASTATFGRSMPSARAKPIAFWQMSRFWSVSGAMFSATSLMTKRRA